jgi:glyoxylate carboligase
VTRRAFRCFFAKPIPDVLKEEGSIPFSAIPAAPSSTFTTNWPGRTSGTSWSATSRGGSRGRRLRPGLGKVGVCLVTSGPGATNTVTGIASAFMDSIPLVVLTGQVPTHLIGNDAFQEVDIVGITRPCTKHNYLVESTKDLARILRRPFYIARSGRPVPVLVDLPKNVMPPAAPEYKPRGEVRLKMKSYNPTYRPT